jgi:MFS family permease
VLLAGAFMVVLDFFIVNVALPSIATELGAMSTTQQIGYALGVAVTGVIYFGASGAGQAFELALIQLTVVAAGVVAAARLLPSRAA